MTPENITPADVQAVADRVIAMIGVTLTSFVCAADTTRRSDDWRRGFAVPNEDQLQRLLVCDAVLSEVTASDGVDMARAWFIGANCCDMTMSPAEAIRNDNFNEAHWSAESFLRNA